MSSAATGPADPASRMVDQMLTEEQAAYRERWRTWLDGARTSSGPALWRGAVAAGLFPDEPPDPVKLALAAEAMAGAPALRTLASGRHRLLAAVFGTAAQRARAFAVEAPVQALSRADRGLRLDPAGDATIATGRIHAVPLAADATLLYLVVPGNEANALYQVSAEAPGVAIEASAIDGSGDVVLTGVKLTASDRIEADPALLNHWLAVLDLLDGLEALATAGRLCRAAVAAAKGRGTGTGGGFDDQGTQFRLADAQARLVIASGYRASLYRRLQRGTIDRFDGAVAKLWLSQCAEAIARVACLTALAPAEDGVAVTGMLADAMRGNMLREVIAARL